MLNTSFKRMDRSLFNDAVLATVIIQRRMIREMLWTQKYWEGSGRSLFEVLSCHLSGGTEENKGETKSG